MAQNKSCWLLSNDTGATFSRAARIIKNPRRWSEIGWRLLFGVFFGEKILEGIKRAYANSAGSEATLLRRYAEVSWGLSKGGVARARGYTYVAYQLQARLANEERSLGAVRIGFEDLEIYARAGDANSSRVYLAGFDESLTLFETYRRLIAFDTAAIDVGANIGIHSLVLSRCVGKNGHVLSYEPNSALCERFKENMTLNEVQNVSLYNVGAGASDSVLRFQPRQGEFNIGLGRFSDDGPLEAGVVKLDSEPLPGRRISLIKIDVEGMELAVIRGARKLVEHHKPALVIECNREWTLQELRDCMPYPISIVSIPETLLDLPYDLDGVIRYDESQNILVRPAP